MEIEFNVYAIVLTWNNFSDLINCINSLRNLNNEKLKILIVDNGSKFKIIDKIEKFLKNEFKIKLSIIDESNVGKCMPNDVTLIKLSNNYGFSVGNNYGLRCALKDEKSKYYWILNDDTEVDKDSLNYLLEKMEHDKSIGICGTRLVYFNDKKKIQAYGGGKYNKFFATTKLIGNMNINDENINNEIIEKNVDFIIGASMFVRREYIMEIGLFYEDLFIYFEDVDWSIRRRNKFKLGYSHESIVYHKEGATIGGKITKSDSKTLFSDYFYLRNKLLITKKHYFYLYPFVLFFSMGISIVLRLKRKQFRRVYLIFKIIYYSLFKNDKIFIRTDEVK